MRLAVSPQFSIAVGGAISVGGIIAIIG